LNRVKSDSCNISRVLTTNSQNYLNDVVDIVEDDLRTTIQSESELDISIILAFPAPFGKAIDASGAVSGDSKTSRAWRLALKALALRLPLGKSVPDSTRAAKIGTEALKTINGAGRAKRRTVDEVPILADGALLGVIGVALQAVADAVALDAVRSNEHVTQSLPTVGA